MRKIDLSNKRNKGRPRKRFMKAAQDDLKVVGSMEEDPMDREKWKRIICCGDA